MVPTEIDLLRKRARALDAEADTLQRAYDRATWVRFTAVFFPVPFIVVMLRLEMEYWHYYVAGTAYLVFSAALYSYDGRAADRCTAARKAADEARAAWKAALPVSS